MATEELSCIDSMDRLNVLLLKAQALVQNAHGQSGETFRLLTDEFQDNYLWAVSDMLGDALKEVGHMVEERWRPSRPSLKVVT